MIEIENCILEWHCERGVLYVHSPTGITLLRICQLPLKDSANISTFQLDITKPEHVSFEIE